MLKGRPLTAIVPARGGSKGLPGKNLLELDGVALVARAARLGTACARIDAVIVSSDDEAILAAARTVPNVTAARRPEELSGDAARSVDVVRHLRSDPGFDDGYVILLQPTSPLRRLADLEAMLDRFEESEAPAMVSVCALDEPRPEKLQRIEAGVLRPYLDGGFEGPRQALPQPYALNGAFYLISSDVLMTTGSFLPTGAIAFEMSPAQSVNIDTALDWQVLQAMVSAGHWSVDDGVGK